MIRAARSATPENLLLGVGAFYKNFVIGTDTPTNSTGLAKCLGATDGGGSFTATPQVRQISVDGLPGKVKGLTAIDGWDAVLALKAKEMTLDNIKMALLNAIDTTDTTTSMKKVTVGHTIEDTDYIDNITWAGTLADKTTPVYIVLKNALDENGFALSVTDKNEAVVDLTFTANYDLDNLEEPPFEIYYPVS